jgi:glyoxylase-like metal-dependent hydrolase (beta-lactamase superfamily II)
LLSKDSDLLFHQLIRENMGCASYIVGSKSKRACILIDPLMDIERYEFFLRNQKLEIVALIDTHTHADHVSGLRFFSRYYPRADIAIHESAPVEFDCRKLKDGEDLTFYYGSADYPASKFSLRAIYTPGHSFDHICLLIEEEVEGRPSDDGDINKKIFLLSGDCLFIGDVGRTDLGRGDNGKMYETLFGRILQLDPNTEVYPAHLGKEHFLTTEKIKTTVGEEKRTNPALQVKNKEEFIRYMTEGWPPKPEYYEEIININLGKSSLLEVQERIAKGQRETYQYARRVA